MKRNYYYYIELNLFSQKYLPPDELIIIECAGHSHAYAYMYIAPALNNW